MAHAFSAVAVPDGSLIQRDDGKFLCYQRGGSQRRSWSRETYRAHRFTHPDIVERELRTLRKGAGPATPASERAALALAAALGLPDDQMEIGFVRGNVVLTPAVALRIAASLTS